MLIPKSLLDLIEQGCEFTLTVIGSDRSRHSYSRPRSKTPILDKAMPPFVSQMASESELTEAFARFDSMTEEEKREVGVKQRGAFMLVAVKGRFAKTFDARKHAAAAKSFYLHVGGKPETCRCHVVQRPKDREPEKLSQQLAAIQTNGTIESDLPKDTSQDPPNWPDLPPNPNARRNPPPDRTPDQLAMDLAARTQPNAGSSERLS
jgi:hypothetical protein